jgi:pimeloyl-ACP methyl ester carboxylesterase
MTTRLPLVDPARIRAATLVVRGKHDGIATEADLAAFFLRLPNADKQFSVLPDLAHCTPLGTERHRLWGAVKTFFDAGRLPS